jgi:hypothetical protein
MQRKLVGLAAVAALAIAGKASAEVVTYNIIPAQSTLTIGGLLTDNSAFQQTAGSLTATFSGTITADRQPSKIIFTGGSSMDAALQPVSQQPRADATNGSAPADYGRSAPGPFGSTSFEALRGVFLDVEDDTGGFGIPISSNNFASNSLILVIDSGDSDVVFGNNGVETSLSGKAAANSNNNGLSSVVVSGSTETLTLKFSTGSIAYSIFQSSDTSLAFTGTIVANRQIPEVAGSTMIAMLGALGLHRRRDR